MDGTSWIVTPAASNRWTDNSPRTITWPSATVIRGIKVTTHTAASIRIGTMTPSAVLPADRSVMPAKSAGATTMLRTMCGAVPNELYVARVPMGVEGTHRGLH